MINYAFHYPDGHSRLGFEPHPEDKKKAGYAKVNLSDLPSF